MAEVSAALVKELRERTGAGMMDCKKALAESSGDIEKAADYLRQKGIAKADKKEGRVAAEGLVHSYIHMGGRIGVLVEINIETDFAARGEKFKQLVSDVAMQIAAQNPGWVRREEVPADVIAREKAIFEAQVKESGKPEKMIPKIVEGKLEKFFAEKCLLEQAFIKEDSKNVETLVKEASAVIGEKITVRRFARFQLGEGIEKKKEDFAAEVAAAAKGA